MKGTRPVCGRCNEEIVGVIPAWESDKPLCRGCAFANSRKKPSHSNGEIKPKGTSGNGNRARRQTRIGPVAGIVVIILGIAALGLNAGGFLGAFEPEKPVYRGAVDLDRAARSCVANLWKVTRLLQDGALQWPDLQCPSTGASYSITHVMGDSIVSCPNPENHNVGKMWVSRTSPVPGVEP